MKKFFMMVALLLTLTISLKSQWKITQTFDDGRKLFVNSSIDEMEFVNVKDWSIQEDHERSSVVYSLILDHDKIVPIVALIDPSPNLNLSLIEDVMISNDSPEGYKDLKFSYTRDKNILFIFLTELIYEEYVNDESSFFILAYNQGNNLYLSKNLSEHLGVFKTLIIKN